MLAASREAGPGTLTLTGMLSLEPLTIGNFVYAGDGGMQRVYAFHRPASACGSAGRRNCSRPARAISRCRSSTSSIRTI